MHRDIVRVLPVKVMDLSEDGFFSLMGEDGEVRDDLKLTENCNPSTAEAVREMLKAAEDANERLMVGCYHSRLDRVLQSA